jgi:pimeloyl-ACP methyl ester carboxylesterase
MPRIEISGVGVEYELMGEAGAQAVAITPGGRLSMSAPGVRELGEALAAGGRRVLLWDRPNCGASDLSFDAPNEPELQGRTLAGLIRALDLGPTALAGGSAGSRASLLAAAHDPGAVSHLIQWWVSGGTVGLMILGSAYFCESAVAAAMGGMQAVAQMPTWAEPLARNPRNREILLGQDREQFVSIMGRWAEAFIPSKETPIPGLPPEAVARLTMPALVLRGSPRDLIHPAWMAEWLHGALPNAEMADAPWTEAEFLARMAEATRSGSGHFLDWPRLAPQILAFTAR